MLCRSGYTADICEQFIAHANIRKDLFGCIDVVAIRPDVAGVLGVQATTASNLGAKYQGEYRSCAE